MLKQKLIQNMNIIITGATGLLGGWLVSDLLKESVDLTIIRYRKRLNYENSKTLEIIVNIF